MCLPRQGKTTTTVWTHSWCIEGVLLENTVSTKDKTFLMAIGNWVYNIQEESASTRNTKGHMLCKMWSPWGIDKPCVFECSPALQVRAISEIPSNPALFPTSSLFTNMDHLFCRVFPQMDDHQFAWILWYIWKWRNNKIFSNLDIDTRETLKLVETESTLWAEAHILNE